MTTGNLYADLTDLAAGETFDDLWRQGHLRIERILSSAQPEPVLYLQEQDEWVLLLEGQALLEVNGERINLVAGDYLLIPARTPHRVLATHPDPRCLWLAVHLYPSTTPATEA